MRRMVRDHYPARCHAGNGTWGRRAITEWAGLTMVAAGRMDAADELRTGLALHGG